MPAACWHVPAQTGVSLRFRALCRFHSATVLVSLLLLFLKLLLQPRRVQKFVALGFLDDAVKRMVFNNVLESVMPQKRVTGAGSDSE